MKNFRGQISLIGTIIGAVGMIGAAFATSWFTANNRIAGTEKSISVIEEREKNRYVELKESINRIESKIDKLSEKMYNK